MFRKIVIASLLIASFASIPTTPNSVSAQNQDEPRRARNRQRQQESKQVPVKGAKTATRDNASAIIKSRIGKLPLTKQQLQVKDTFSSVSLSEKSLSILNRIPSVEKVLRFQGNKAYPRAGYKMNKLANGSLLISQDKPLQAAMEGWIGTFDGGYLFVLCYCNDSNAESDNCRFENGTATSPGTCGGGTCCRARFYLNYDGGFFDEVPTY
jgi:hypothetical protein